MKNNTFWLAGLLTPAFVAALTLHEPATAPNTLDRSYDEPDPGAGPVIIADAVKLPDGTIIDEAGDLGAGLVLPFAGSVSDMGNAFAVENTWSGLVGNPVGIYGATTNSGVGVYGLAAAAEGQTAGVSGESLSTSGFGVKGLAAAAEGQTIGIAGQSRSTSGIGVNGNASATSGTTRGVRGVSFSDSGTGVYGVATARSGTNYGVYGLTSSPDGYAGYFVGGRNYFEGNVGIGTSSPADRLHVRKQTTTSDLPERMLIIDSHDDPNNFNLRFGSGSGILFKVPYQSDSRVGASIDAVRATNVEFNSETELVFSVSQNDETLDEAMRIDQNGNVGIGTTDPRRPLHVSDNAEVIALEGRNHAYIAWYPDGFDNGRKGFMGWANAGDDDLTIRNEIPDAHLLLRTTGSGNVGIGTRAPDVRLHVDRGTDARPGNRNAGYVLIGDTAGYNIIMDNNEIMARNNEDPLDPNAPAQLFINNEGGDVKIGQNPLSGFTTTVYVPVLAITGGADLAEKFPVSEKVQPGVVVEIDPDNPGQLRVARGAYNRRVAGVVSGANGLPAGVLLGNLPNSQDAPAIALSGRVWVNGDASNGPIQPGDLLTTSATAGHAMKVTDYRKAQGAIIGKAMTSLESGQGLVLVLVSLQ